MKNIKLLSVVALALFGATAVSGVVSADQKQTNGSIEFDNDMGTEVTPTDPKEPGKEIPKPDITDPENPNVITPGPSGGLFLGAHPKNFNFGTQKVGASDIFSGKILTFDGQASNFNDTKYDQAVEVHDGRIDLDDWTLTAKLSAFNTGKLTGTTITIENADTRSEFKKQEPLLASATNGKTEISQKSAVNFLKSNPQAKGDTSAVWANASDVKIHVPANQITKGAHTATVDWTLVAGAN
jgi:hypothetical protein